MSTLVNQANRFISCSNRSGFDVLADLCHRENPPNGIAISPLCIATAMAMVAGGCDKATAVGLCRRIGILDTTDLDKVIKVVLESIREPSDMAGFIYGNALFIDDKTILSFQYARFLSKINAGALFSSPTMADGVDNINKWIESRTVSTKPLTKAMLQNWHLALVSALSFDAPFEHGFNPAFTVQRPFFVGHKAKQIPMMMRYHEITLVARAPDYIVACLPFHRNLSRPRWLFYAYLPAREKPIQDMIRAVRENGVQSLRFKRTLVNEFMLPKFTVRFRTSFISTMERLGFPLSRTIEGVGDGRRRLDRVLHNVAIDLDERMERPSTVTETWEHHSPEEVEAYIARVLFEWPFVYSIVAEDSKLVLLTGVFSVPVGS